MTWNVVFSPRALDQLIELDGWIATAASPEVAARYTDVIVDFCRSLSTFPRRGTRREDIRPGLRVTHCRRRTVIAFATDEATQRVSILGIFHGGRDYETILQEASSRQRDALDIDT